MIKICNIYNINNFNSIDLTIHLEYKMYTQIYPKFIISNNFIMKNLIIKNKYPIILTNYIDFLKKYKETNFTIKNIKVFEVYKQ